MILALVTIEPDLVKLRGSLRASWKLLASLALVHTFAALVHGPTSRFPNDLPVPQNLLGASTWFLLLCSTIALLNALLPSDEKWLRHEREEELRRKHSVKQPVDK
ncbi:MAG: hypothetical protein ACI9C2_002546 [Gammaproteobacteria bacterium]